MKKSILSSVLTFLIFAILALVGTADCYSQESAPPTAAASATAETPAPTQPTAPAPAAESPKARREDLEPKSLGEAKTALKHAREDRDSAERERDEARAESKRLADQFEAMKTAANIAKKELADALAKLGIATRERDEAREQHRKASENVTRLEALCGVKGIDPAEAIATAQKPAAVATEADFQKRLNEAKSPSEIAKVLDDWKAHVRKSA